MGNIANGLKEAAKVVALLGGTGICFDITPAGLKAIADAVNAAK